MINEPRENPNEKLAHEVIERKANASGAGRARLSRREGMREGISVGSARSAAIDLLRTDARHGCGLR
jgi:cysteine synthase